MVKPVENYLYFCLDGVPGNGTGDAAVYPVSTFLGATFASATRTIFRFKDNAANTISGAVSNKFNAITLEHANISTNPSIHMDIVKAMCKIMANPGRGEVLVVATVPTNVDGFAEEFETLNNITGVSCKLIAETQG